MEFNKAFFEKHQKRLLQVANSRLFRWILGLNRLPKELKDWKIDQITPSSIRRTTNKGYQTIFFTRNRFAEALAFNLSPFAYLQTDDLHSWKWRFSPIGTIGIFALWLSGIPIIFGTTTAYSPTALESQIGNTAGTYDSTWAQMRSGDRGTKAVSSTGDYWGQNGNDYPSACVFKDGNGIWSFHRTHIAFDTTGLIETPTSAFIHAVAHNHGASRGGGVVFTDSTVVSDTTLATSDWAQVSDTALSDTLNYADISNGTGYDIDLNASGISNIVTEGYSKFCLRNTYDQANSEQSGWGPGSVDWATFRSSRYTGTESDPYLSITTASSSNSPSLSPSSSNSPSQSPSASSSNSPSLSPSSSNSPSSSSSNSPSNSPSLSPSSSQSPSASSSNSPSLSPSSSNSPSSSSSNSPSNSPSLSPSSSQSPSASSSNSPSLSPSSSNSPSSSSSNSLSLSPSSSNSPSESSSASVSPSVPPGSDFTREANAIFPDTSADLATAYSVQDYIDVSAEDSVYVDITGTGYLMHQFSYQHTNNVDEILIHCVGKSSLAPTASTVYLQLWNWSDETWDTIATEGSADADTNFDFSGNMDTDVARYYEAGTNAVLARIWQLNA